ARVLRGSSRQVVDHQVDDPRLGDAAPISPISRSEPVGRRARQGSRGRVAEPDVTSAAGGAPGASEAPGDPGDNQARAELTARCNAIEEAYEFMLAYASQGLPNEQGSVSGSQIRQFLNRCDDGLSGLAELLSEYVRATRG